MPVWARANPVPSLWHLAENDVQVTVAGWQKAAS